MKYQSHRNSLVVNCSECQRDITLEKQFYDIKERAIYCEDCNEFHEIDEDDR